MTLNPDLRLEGVLSAADAAAAFGSPLSMFSAKSNMV